jgi:hypothetical protein
MGTSLTTAAPDVIQRMAMVKPASWSEDDRSFEVVVSTERNVGDGVILSHDSAAFRFPGAPVPATIDHSRQSKDVWGVIDELRFERVDGVMSLIGRGRVDGTDESMAVAIPRLRNGSARFSVGARVHALRDADGQSDLLRAVDWEVGEVSLVVVGMDSASIMRSPDQSHVPDHPMPDETNKAGVDPATEVERTASTEQPTITTPEPAPAVSAEVEEVKRSMAELRRENKILDLARKAGLDDEKTAELVRSGKPVDEVAVDVFTFIRDHKMSQAPAGHPARGVEVTRDQGDTLMRGIEEALVSRVMPGTKVSDLGREYRGYTLLEYARMYLESRGTNTRGMGKTELVQRGFHSTSDFPLLFSNLAGKSLDAAYQEEPHTWSAFSRQRNLPDFKLASDLVVAADLTPEPLLEGGEYKAGTLQEAQHQWKLATYARKVTVTRQAIINDDLSALERVPELLGRGFRRLESNIIWGLLTAGGTGAITSVDGLALFDAGHNNTYSGATSVIGTAGLNSGKQLMRKQTDIAGNRINLTPSYMLVPTDLEATALQFLFPNGFMANTRTGPDGPVTVQSAGIELIVEPRLDGKPKEYYLAASPSRVETIVYGYLAGEEGPTITTSEKRDPDGVELLARFDFGAAVKDFRGFVRSKGEA